MNYMNQIWLTFASAEFSKLTSPLMWVDFLTSVETCLKAKLIRLDENDPIRKKVTSIEDAAKYICAFRKQEESRWLFGKLSPEKIDLDIALFKKDTFSNDVRFCFPHKFLQKEAGIEIVIELFKLGNQYLNPFYTYCDSVERVTSKKKYNGKSISLQAELEGIFWLTFFNKKYIDFFGREKFKKLPIISDDENGIVIKLGDSPFSSDFVISRKKAEEILGENSFVNPVSEEHKPPGKYALTFEQIREK